MFQNISEDDVEVNENTNGDKRKQIIQKLKELFAPRNTVLYLLSFFISMVPGGNFALPIGLAMFASACSNEIPAGIIFLASAIGTAIGFGKTGLLTFALTVLVFMFSIVLFKPDIDDSGRNEKKKLGVNLFFSFLLVQAGSLIFSGFYLYNILQALALSLTSYIFYKIFSNGIVLIKEYGEKTVFVVEEVMAACVMLTIAFSSFGNIRILGLNITNVLCILMVLVLGWKNGVLVGGTAGVTIGVLLGVICGENVALIGAYALSRNDSRGA